MVLNCHIPDWMLRGLGGALCCPHLQASQMDFIHFKKKRYSSRNCACHVAVCADFVWPRPFNLDL